MSFGHAQHPQEMLGCSSQASRFNMIEIRGWVMKLVWAQLGDPRDGHGVYVPSPHLAAQLFI